MANRSLLPLIIVLTLSACANRVETARPVSGTWFGCEDGLIFSAERTGGRMLIVMSDGRSFELAPASTAFGELFRSNGTSLRIDDDFAVLTGGPVQNYTRCRLMSRGA